MGSKSLHEQAIEEAARAFYACFIAGSEDDPWEELSSVRQAYFIDAMSDALVVEEEFYDERGWKLVPREVTDEMEEQGEGTTSSSYAQWQAMYDAAPSPRDVT